MHPFSIAIVIFYFKIFVLLSCSLVFKYFVNSHYFNLSWSSLMLTWTIQSSEKILFFVINKVIVKIFCKIKNSCVISKRLFNRCKGRRKERSEIDQRENPKEKVIRKKTSLFLLFKVLKSLTSLRYDWS